MLEKLLTKEIISPIFIIIIAVLFYLLIKQIIIKTFKASSKFGVHKKSITIMNLVVNVLKYVTMIIAVLMILGVWGIDTKVLIASLGAVGVVAGLALQDTLKDFLAGFSIILDDEYDIGDNIQIGTFRGDVIELGMKNTKIKSYTGEIKMIANRMITEVINYSIHPSKCVVDLSVSYEDDLLTVEEILKQVCEDLSRRITYLTSDVQLLGVEKLSDSSVVYRMVADCEPLKDFELKREIHKSIKLAFDEHNLDIPYPQVVVHNEQ